MNRDAKPTTRDPGSDLLDALVRAERADAPAPKAQEHTWERVAGTVGSGAPTPLDPGSVAGPGAGASWLELVLMAVLGSALGVGAVLGYRAASEPDPAPVAAKQASAQVQPQAPPAPAPPPATSPAPASPPPVPAPALAPQALTPARATAGPAQAAPRTPASDLAEETRLLARARARVRAEAPTEALAPLAEHARRFPNGQLREDRMVLQAIARCESGDAAGGKRAADALRKAFPDSSHLPRVERACAG